jgi:hypothetical protein
MKIGDFIPDIANRDAKLVEANSFLNKIYDNGFGNFYKSSTGRGFESSVQPYGVEQLYWEWLRTAYAYRRMFIQDLYLLAFDSTEIRTPLLHLRNQVFKKGFDDWKPVFKLKCTKCGKEYQEKVLTCEKCEGTEFREPDPEQYKKFDEMRVSCNSFGQSLEDILKTVEDDVNMIDDGYILLNKKYIDTAGKLYGKIIEIRRIHPALIEIELDKSGLSKNSHWICLFHRDNNQIKPGKCEVDGCGHDLVPTMYVYNHRGRRVYLPEDEMIHISKFSPSETYGYSILLTIMQKVLTLNGMDKFLYRYFFERKVPTGMIMTGTDDPQSLEVERARVESKMAEDPTYIPWVAVSQRTGRGRTDFIRLFNTLQEMDYLPVRNEIRDRIAAAYGVPQMYMNVMEGIGGLSGQTQQLKVFNDVIQADQRIFNEKVFPILLRDFGITDWILNLRPPEEKVEGQILQLAQQKVVIAGQMFQMGFEVELKPECRDMETLDFSFSGESVSQEKQQAKMMQSQMAMQTGGVAGLGVPPGTAGAGGMSAPAGYGAPNMEANRERTPNETGAPEAVKNLPVWEKGGRNEDAAVRENNLTDKEENSGESNRIFQNKQP